MAVTHKSNPRVTSTSHVHPLLLLITLIPSFLALDAPVNEEKQISQLLENEQNSHSDHGLGIRKIEGSEIRNIIRQAPK